MTVEEMFEKYNEEYIHFERIPVDERLSEVESMCGLLYINKLIKDPTKFEMAADHDIIYITPIQALRGLDVEDVIYLCRCGIHYNDEYECLAIFT